LDLARGDAQLVRQSLIETFSGTSITAAAPPRRVPLPPGSRWRPPARARVPILPHAGALHALPDARRAPREVADEARPCTPAPQGTDHLVFVIFSSLASS
jgi:hypothetical protein